MQIIQPLNSVGGEAFCHALSRRAGDAVRMAHHHRRVRTRVGKVARNWLTCLKRSSFMLVD